MLREVVLCTYKGSYIHCLGFFSPSKVAGSHSWCGLSSLQPAVGSWQCVHPPPPPMAASRDVWGALP